MYIKTGQFAAAFSSVPAEYRKHLALLQVRGGACCLDCVVWTVFYVDCWRHWSILLQPVRPAPPNRKPSPQNDTKTNEPDPNNNPIPHNNPPPTNT